MKQQDRIITEGQLLGVECAIAYRELLKKQEIFNQYVKKQKEVK